MKSEEATEESIFAGHHPKQNLPLIFKNEKSKKNLQNKCKPQKFRNPETVGNHQTTKNTKHWYLILKTFTLEHNRIQNWSSWIHNFLPSWKQHQEGVILIRLLFTFKDLHDSSTSSQYNILHFQAPKKSVKCSVSGTVLAEELYRSHQSSSQVSQLTAILVSKTFSFFLERCFQLPRLSLGNEPFIFLKTSNFHGVFYQTSRFPLVENLTFQNFATIPKIILSII